MPQVVVPSPCFLRKGHLKSISQQAPQRLQSPRRKLKASMTSSFLKRMRTKRRSLPCAWRARNLASATASARFAASRSSKERRCRAARLAVVGLIYWRLTRANARAARASAPGRVVRARRPLSSGAGRAALDVLVDHARDGLLRGRADDALFFLAVLEEDERRDALDAVALRDLRVVVHVELDDRGRVLEVLRDGLDRRRQHPAGRAPRRPEVHEHWLVRIEHIRLEVAITHFPDVFTHEFKSP